MLTWNEGRDMIPRRNQLSPTDMSFTNLPARKLSVIVASLVLIYAARAAAELSPPKPAQPEGTVQRNATILSWDDPTPRALFYAGFDDPQKLVTIGTLGPQRVVLESGKFGQGLVIAKGIRPGSALIGPGHQLDTLRGTLTFWLRLNSTEHEGPTEIVSIWPGPPQLQVSFRAQRPTPEKPGEVQPGEVSFTVEGQRISSGNLALLPGDWHHIAWT